MVLLPCDANHQTSVVDKERKELAEIKHEVEEDLEEMISEGGSDSRLDKLDQMMMSLESDLEKVEESIGDKVALKSDSA